MAPVKKYTFLGIFISILAIFGMSHNVFASDLPFDISNYNYMQAALAPNHDCVYGNDTTSSNVQYCATTSSNLQTAIKAITTHSEFSINAGDYVVFYLTIWNNSNATSAFNLVPTPFEPNVFRLISVYEAVGDIYESAISGSISGVQYDQLNMNVYSMSQKYIRFVFQAKEAYRGRLGLYTTSSTGVLTGASLTARMYGVGLYRKNNSSSPDQQKEINETNNAVSDSENAGGSSTTDAQQGSASLLTAIGGFFSVITSASPTNCVFNAPLNTHFGNQRLNVDLCALTLPSQIGALTSIIAIGVLIPFAIHMFKKFVSLFRSFQS